MSITLGAEVSTEKNHHVSLEQLLEITLVNKNSGRKKKKKKWSRTQLLVGNAGF